MESSQQQQPVFPVVGIGGSAGGLAAAQTFFANMPADSGIAFVLILHLSPEYESNLSTIIGQITTMPVVQVLERVLVEPNHIYVISPNKELWMDDGHIQVAEPEASRGQRAPIDLFFRTLAESHGRSAAAVVLSGTGADGSIGLPRVKENGGIAFVQDPNEAEYDAMPRNAITTGLVDLVLPVAKIPERLVDYWSNADTIHLSSAETLSPVGRDDDTIRAIFALMRARTGHDFSQYKLPTILRRIGRRMLVRSVTNLQDYLVILRSQPNEAQSLLRDLLISVTNFFRDGDAWQSVQRVVPNLFAEKNAVDTVRLWVVGCASGEEAYTIAMLLYEFAESLPYRPNMQIFATDIDEDAIAHARQGLYLDTIASDISPERLQRFFSPEQGRYRVRREIRDMVLFAVHNVLHDPPFSRLDMVTCRNVLIYLNRTVQEQVLQLFHFTLQSNGYLLLGASESTDGVPGLFTPIDKNLRLYQRRLVPTAAPLPVPALPMGGATRERSPAPRSTVQAIPSFDDLDVYVLANIGPPTIIVNEDYEIVHLARGAGQLLELADGEPSHNLLKVIQRDLRLDVRAALFQALKQGEPTETRTIVAEIGGERRSVQVRVQPLKNPEWARGYIAVVFRVFAPVDDQSLYIVSDTEPVVHQLEEELNRSKDQLRTTIEQYETVVEEYKAANEELQAINEELRAATEELETSKEELQSVNEELTTVNQEYKHKIEEVSQTNNDLQNFMASSEIGTIFVDRELRIKRYTPSTEAIFNLIPADTNRPLAHVTHKLDYSGLVDDTKRVLASLMPIEREVHSSEGRWYLARLQPYRTTADQINGVVLTFVDITESRQAESELRKSQKRLQLALQATNTGTFLYYIQEDRGEPDERTLALFGLPPDNTRNFATAFANLIHPDDRSHYVEEVARAIDPAGVGMLRSDIRVVHPDDSIHWISIAAQALFEGEPRRATLMYGIATDITERKRTETNLAFLAEVSEGLEQLTTIEEAVSALGARIAAYLGLSACAFAELSETAEIAVINYGWHRSDVPSLLGTYRMEEFVTPEILQLCLAGKTVVIRDVFDDPKTNGKQYAALNIGSFVSVPLMRDGKWRFLLVVYRSEPYGWRDDEIELVRELASRIWIRLERARSETALRESEQRLQELTKNLPSGAAFIVDRDLRYILAEGQALRDTDLQSGDLVGKTLPDLFDPALRIEQERLYRQALGGEPFVTEHAERDHIYSTHGVPLRDANNNIYAVLAVSYDITERRLAEEALRINEERLRLIINSVHDYAIFTIEPDGTIESWNVGAEQIFGYSQAEALGQDWSMLFSEEDQAENMPQQEIEHALRDGSLDKEGWKVRKDGSTFFVSGVLTSVVTNNKVRWLVKVLRDQTERKQAEQRLEQRVIKRTIKLSETNAALQAEIEQRRVAERERQDILRQLVSAQEAERQRLARELHDQFGQQVSGLRLGLAALARNPTSDSQQTLERLQQLAQQLDSDISRLALELRPSVLDNLGLQAALQQHIDDWSALTGVAVDLQFLGFPDNLSSEVEIVLYRVAQEALNNIAKHAVASEVSIILDHRNNEVQLIIEDNGQGFDLEAVNNSRSQRLGLVGMRERLTLRHGTLTIESSPGEGTTIFARMPLDVEENNDSA